MTKNPFADPKHPIDYNLKGEDVKLTERKPEQPPVPETPKQGMIAAASYKGIEFEQPAYREQGNADKQLLYFDKSLEHLRAAGFERHARPQEVFGLLIDGLEGKLTGSISDVQKDMLTSYGEWLSLSFERKGPILIAHLDPEGLVWNGKVYVKENFKEHGHYEFNVSGKKSNEWIPLKEFDNKLIEFLYTRPFKDLPKEIREGDRYARIALPPDGTAWPVGRVSGWYDVGVDGGRASRGVRSASAKKSP
jgi:hypothetical protein